MTRSAVRGSSSEGSLHRSLSISARRAAPLSRRSVAVKRTESGTRPFGSLRHSCDVLGDIFIPVGHGDASTRRIDDWNELSVASLNDDGGIEICLRDFQS